MILKGKKVYLEDAKNQELNIKGLYATDDFISLDNIFIEKSIEEMNKPVPRVYSYFVKENNGNKVIGIISFEIISMMNEYRLGRLHFVADDLTLLIEGLDLILEWQILKNNMLKIVVNEGSFEINEVLMHENFVKTVFKDGKSGYKITKPIYIERRGDINNG